MAGLQALGKVEEWVREEGMPRCRGQRPAEVFATVATMKDGHYPRGFAIADHSARLT